jgi:hypothetical protein
MSLWRPSPDEERWLEVASQLGSAVPAAALAERTGGWRRTGPLARIALFALGFVAAALLFGVLGFGSETMLLIAGLTAAFAAEWLSVQKRLHASGIEEGLTVAGFLMIGLWIAVEVLPSPGRGDSSLHTFVVIAAVGAAGLRRLNAFVTTCAIVGLVYWFGSTGFAESLDAAAGRGVTAFGLGCALAALALFLGAREFRRPSHDRMLDWMVATLPIAAYAQLVRWSPIDALDTANQIGVTRSATIVVLLALGTALLATGLRRRRHAPLWGFLGCAVALAVELRAAVPVATETWLIGWGLAALVAGVLLDRYLREPRSGLTSASLARGEGPFDLLQMAGTALLTHRATPESQPAAPEFEGGGGKFGGGGASGGY